MENSQSADKMSAWDRFPRAKKFEQRRSHITGMVYFVSKYPPIDKLVLVAAKTHVRRPLRGAVTHIAHFEVSQDEENSILSGTSLCLNDKQVHSCAFPLWGSESDACGISRIAASMAPGETCLVRKIVSSENTELHIFKCLDVYRRQVLCVSPKVVLEHSCTNLPMNQLRDCTAALHFKAFKRPSGDGNNVKDDSSDLPDIMKPVEAPWLLVYDTRQQGGPFHLLLGQGRHMPCLEMIMEHLGQGGRPARLFSSYAFNMGPYPQGASFSFDFDELQIDRDFYSKTLSIKENDDLLLVDIEVAEIIPPDYESSSNRMKLLHSLGNELLSKQMFNKALHRYTDALMALGVKDLQGPLLTPSEQKYCISLLLNKTLCYMSPKIQNWELALEIVSQILDLEPDNVKALARKAKCLRCRDKVSDLEKALEAISKASRLDPRDKGVAEEKRRIKRLLKEEMSAFDGLKGRSGWFKESMADESREKPLLTFETFRQLVLEG